MTEFTKQYSIRMPDGQLYSRATKTNEILEAFGVGVGNKGGQPFIYDTLEEAQEMLETLKDIISRMGVREWLGVIETRWCSPFTQTDLAAETMADLEKWMDEQ